MTMKRSGRGASSATDFWFDRQAADEAEEFFVKYLVHVKGEWAGQPLELLPWERDKIIRPLFGWKRADGTRRYRTVYVEVGKKNGKSTIAAGIALKCTFADHEPGAEVYSAAADRFQARIVFDIAKAMVEANKYLDERSTTYMRSIVVPKWASRYEVLSSDTIKTYSMKHGINAHAVIFDELHTQPTRRLYDVLDGAGAARRQPIHVYLTTAGFDRNSICFEVHDYAVKVLKGIIEDDSFLAVIYAAADDADWRKPSTWKKANPSLGVTIKREFLWGKCKKAVEVPGYENTFRRLHLNQWTEQASRWLPMAKWDACDQVAEADEIEGEVCFGGLDLASTTDVAALVLVFPSEEGVFDVLARFWVPEENIQGRVQRDKVPYDVWVRQGFIKATAGNVIDYDVIRADINALGEIYNIKEIAIDRWNATQITTQLMGDGFTVVPFGQGFASMSAPSKELEASVLGERLAHGGNPVLRWMASNVAIKRDAADNMKPDKEKSTERIDGITALVMAIARAIVQEDDESIYEKRGILTV